MLTARGAVISKPDAPIVQGAMKTAEDFRSFVRAYRAGSDGKLSDVVSLSKETWTLAENAKQISPTLGQLSSQVQVISKSMADQARALAQSSSAT